MANSARVMSASLEWCFCEDALVFDVFEQLPLDLGGAVHADDPEGVATRAIPVLVHVVHVDGAPRPCAAAHGAFDELECFEDSCVPVVVARVTFDEFELFERAFEQAVVRVLGGVGTALVCDEDRAELSRAGGGVLCDAVEVERRVCFHCDT